MHRKPIISIITPVWNGLPFLKECIDSVLLQDFINWEFLISDNGSTDGTREYLDTLTDERIRVFKQPENLGIMGNLNFLFSQAKAPLSQILCADDYFLCSSSLSTIIGYWERAPERMGFVCFNHCVESKSRSIRLENEITPKHILSNQTCFWFFTFGNIPGNLSNVSLRTAVVAQVGYFDRTLPAAGDFDFWSRVAGQYDMGVQPEHLIYVRRHDQVASNYLNLKGELFAQQTFIYERLSKGLSLKLNKKKLRLFFNMAVSVPHMAIGIKLAIKGRSTYIRQIFKTKSSLIWPAWLLLLCCVPIAFLNKNQRLQVLFARHLLRNWWFLQTISNK